MRNIYLKVNYVTETILYIVANIIKATNCKHRSDITAISILKVVANEDNVADTLLRTQMFPRLPARATFVADTNLCPRHKNVSDFFQKHFVSVTNVSRFAQHRNNHEQQCVRNIVSSFATTLISYLPQPMLPHLCMKYIYSQFRLPLAGKMISLASVLYLVAGNKPLRKLSIFDVSFHLYCPAFEVVTLLSS